MKFEDVENARKIYNDKRKRVRNKTLVIIFSILGVSIIIGVLTTSKDIHNIFTKGFEFLPIVIFPILFSLLIPLFFATIITAIIVSIKTRKEAKDYIHAYKAYFISQQLSRFFTDLAYNHEAGLAENVLSSTGIIYTGDRYHSNDLTQGKYKNVSFTQADVTIQDKHEDSDGNTTYITVFKGRYMIFEFPKKFNFRMVISPGRYRGSFRSTGNRKFKKIELESIDFNKHFSVYAEDGFEAFYILDPAFMTRVEELAQKYNNKITLYFTDGKLFIGINDGNDSFEPPKPNTPINEKVETEKVINDIRVITDLVDSLRLDR